MAPVLLLLVAGVLLIPSINPTPAAAQDKPTEDLESFLVDVPALAPGARIDHDQRLTAQDMAPADTPGAEINRALYVGGQGWVYDLGDLEIRVVLLETRTAQAAAAFAKAQGSEPFNVAPDSWRGDSRQGGRADLGYAGSIGRLVTYVGVVSNGATPDEVLEQDALAQRLYLAQRAQLPVLGDLLHDDAQALAQRFGYVWGVVALLVTLLGVLVGLALGVATDRGSREWWQARRVSTTLMDGRWDLTQRLRRDRTLSRVAPLARGIVLAGVVGLAVAWPSLGLWQGAVVVVMVVFAWTLVETWLRNRHAGSDLARGRIALVVTTLGGFAGTLLVVAGVGMMSAAVTGLVLRHPSATPLVVLPMVIFGMEIISWSRQPVRLAKRLLQPLVRGQVENDCRAPLLLLRSFQDDALEVRPPSASIGAIDTFSGEARVRFEEVIAWTAWSHGPLRTFGQPGARLQPLGAVRDYHDDDQWQEAIRAVADRAHALLLVVGRSPSLVWEIGDIRRRERLARTVFVFPPVDDAETARRVATVCAALDLDRRVLDPGPHRRLLALAFDEAGTPTTYVAAGRSSDAYVMAFTGALAAVSTYDLAGSPVAWAYRPGGDPMADVAAFNPDSISRRRTVMSWVSAIVLNFVPV